MSEERLRILLLDDEESLRIPLSKYLTYNFGYQVDSAASSVEALALVEANQGRYDVALIDEVLVPPPDGIEVMREIRRSYPDVECIIFTGWGMERALEALHAGAYRYLAKPLNLDELGMTIRMALERHQLKQQLETTKQEKEWLRTFLEVGMATTSVLELDEVLERVHEQVGRLMDASCLDVVLYDENSQTLRFELGYDEGKQETKWERQLTQGQGLTDWVIGKCQPLLVKDYLNEELLVPAYQRGAISRSWLGVPLVARNRVIGAITVQSSKPYQFNETHQQILTAIATHVASAIENARLFSGLTQTKQWREALIENAFDAVIAIDQSKRITVFNQRAEEMFGWTAEEMIGQTVAQLHMDVGKAKELFDAVNRERTVSAREVELKHRNGIRIPALLSATLIQDGEGRPIGQAGFMRDLRQKNLLEDQLRALIRANQAISGTLELDKVLDLVVESAIAAFPAAKKGAIHLYDEKTGMLHIKANVGYSPEVAKAVTLKAGEGRAGWVYEHATPLVVGNVQEDERSRSVDRLIDQPEVYEQKSTICVPLVVRGRAIGTLSLDNLSTVNAFKLDDIGLLSTFAAQAASAIENARLYRDTYRRGQLLTALDEASRHMRAERETSKLLHEVVRLAAQLVGCTTGALFINRPHLGELELDVVYGLNTDLIGSRLPHTKGIAGLVAHTGKSQIIVQYSNWPNREDIFEPYHFKTAVGVPLKKAGEAEAVLLVADNTGLQEIAQADLEIIERFAVQAALALETSRLMSREQRMFRHLAILHQISDYIQAAGDLDKILHAVLTGVTAGYGLGFNRAALLLLDERQEYLIGRMGIGQLAEPEARQDWALHHAQGMEDFGRYLEELERNVLPLTPVGERIREVRLPVTSAACGLFLQAMGERRCTLVTQDELDKLPESFVKAFEPALPLVLAPLMARGRGIGLLVGDNKFTQFPVTSEDEESLLTFVNTAAVAIENAQLYQEAKIGRERLRSFYEASNALISSQDLERVLKDIVERACVAAQADGVSMVLIDRAEQVQSLITAGVDKPADITDLVRPNGLSMQAMRTGDRIVIEDVGTQSHRVNPSMFWRQIAAALCLPAAVEGVRLGVMWFHYLSPRRFSRTEIEAVQLYVNQAALAYDSARRIKELEYMRQAAEALAGAANSQDVLKQIVESACEVLQADSAAIWSYDDVRDSFILESSVSSGIPTELWQEFRNEEPRRGRTAYTVMEQGWVGVSDVADIERYAFLGASTRKLLDKIEVKSFQGIALTVGDEKLGVLYVNYRRPHSFHEKEQGTARTFANHAALALKKARLLEQVSKARDAAKVVAEVTVLGDLNDTLASIVQRTQDVLGSDAVTLYTYDQDKGKLGYPPAMVGVRDSEKAMRLAEVPRDSIVFQILHRNELYVVEDTASDELFQGRRFTVDEGIKSCVAISLKVGDRKVGVIFVNYRTRHSFTADELINVELFANQAAVAIRNAQLYEGLQEHTKTLETLYDAGKTITASLELGMILARILKQAQRLTMKRGKEACFGDIMLVDGGRLRFAAAFPDGVLERLQQQFERGVEFREGADSRVGITGRAVRTGESQLVNDVTQDPDFYQGHERRTLSELTVPIKIGERVIGVINVEHPELEVFDEGDRQALESLAAQAAVAVQNAQLFEDVQWQAHVLQTLYEAGQVITSSLSLPEILDRIAEQAWQLAEPLGEKQAQFSHLALLEGRTLRFVAAYPREHLQKLRTIVGDIDLDHAEHIGITGRVVKTGHSQQVNDVTQDSDYLMYGPTIHAELAVPIQTGGQVIGVINVEHPNRDAFDEEDQRALESLASQAAIAIQNARAYEELKRTKGLVGARTAVAWMGMASAAWRHRVGNYATTIEDLTKLLQSDLDARVSMSKLKQRLTSIRNAVTKIRETPITAPLSSEEGVELVLVNDLVRERVRQLQDREWELDTSVQYRLALNLEEGTTVRASPEWLKRVLDVLIDNSIEAMGSSATKELAVGTRLVDNDVEIAISDTGKGIPDDVLPKLLKEPIKKPRGVKGAGMGLLQAQTIAQTYGGDICVGTTGVTGTTMIIRLPVER